MGEAVEKWKERIEHLKPYIISMNLLKLTKNPEVKFMHCLPAFHNKETKIGEEIFNQY